MICVIAQLLIAADDSKEGVRLPTLEPDSAFEGRWELISIPRGHDPMESAERTLVVIAGTWGEEAKDDGQTIRWKVRRTAARPLYGIDVTIIHTNGITE